MKKSLILASLLMLSSSVLVATDVVIVKTEEPVNNSTIVETDSFALGTSISNFNSTSHETLYMPQGYPTAGRKISELTWEAKNVKLLGINAAYDLYNGLGFYADYKKNISTGNGVIDDLDWVNNTGPSQLTHWSHHDNTDVDNVSILDLGIKYNYVFDNIDVESISSINSWFSLGYKQENQKFETYDGYGEYYGVPVSFSGHGLTYEQEYKGAYIGLGADLENKNYLLNLAIKYSPLISSEYTDRHHMRTPPFTETTNFDKTTMINFNIGLGYRIDKQQTIKLAYEYTKYSYVRGDRTRSGDDGTVNNWTGSAALDSKNNIIKFNYYYNF